MNRTEKRAFLRKFNTKGMTEEQKRILLNIEESRRNKETFLEGEKVKINYEKITKYPDYNSKLDIYKQTIEELKDKECTVVYDKKYTTNPYLVCLEEDKKELKTLFFIGDLIKVSPN